LLLLLLLLLLPLTAGCCRRSMSPQSPSPFRSPPVGVG